MFETPRPPSNILILTAAAQQARDLAAVAKADGDDARVEMLIENAEAHEAALAALPNDIPVVG